MARTTIQKQRRRQILQALHQRLLIKPFDKTSIKEIAAEAGLNHGMLHYYFKSKEDILLAYIDYQTALYKKAFTRWLDANRKQLSQEDGLITAPFDFMEQEITFDRDLSKIFIEIWEISIYNEKVKEKLKDMYRAWITTFASHLAELIDDHKKAYALSALMVSFSEGLSLLSVILDDSDLSFGTLYQMFKNLIPPSKIG